MIDKKPEDRLVVTPNELDVLEQVSTHEAGGGRGRPFLLVNVDAICRHYGKWASSLPRLRLFFPVRFNSDPVLLSMLSALGAGFSCSNKRDMDTVLDGLAAVSPRRIFFGNVCKRRSHIEHARNLHVDLTMFSDSAELDKIHDLHPKSRLLLKVAHSAELSPFDVDYSAAGVDEPIVDLLKKAERLGLDVVGVCHNCRPAEEPLRTRLEKIRDLFVESKALFNFEMRMIYFEGVDPTSGASGGELSTLLDELFPESEYPKLKILGEANARQYGAAAFTLCSPVVHVANGGAELVVNDGGCSKLPALDDDEELPAPVPIRLRPDGCDVLAGDTAYTVTTTAAAGDKLQVMAGRIQPDDVLVWVGRPAATAAAVSRTYFCSFDLWKTLGTALVARGKVATSGDFAAA